MREPQEHRERGARDRGYKMLVDGAWVAAGDGATFSCTDPFTEASWGGVPLADHADVDAAVRAARRAFDADGWPQTPPAQRAARFPRSPPAARW
jgi:aldehyde dehydrogenase (NAD+)